MVDQTRILPTKNHSHCERREHSLQSLGIGQFIGILNPFDCANPHAQL